MITKRCMFLALVIHTGENTLFGQLTQSLGRITETAFEKRIRHFGYFILRVTVVLSLLILTTNLIFDKPVFDSILFALALAVGMAPELLPAILTFAMSVGAKRMMKKKVIVKKLSSVFNFGEVQVLCMDKTGTITEGSVQVYDIVDHEGRPDPGARLFAYLNAFFQGGYQNPTDEALRFYRIPSSRSLISDPRRTTCCRHRHFHEQCSGRGQGSG